MKTGFLPHLAAVASLHAAACAPPATVARGEDASATLAIRDVDGAFFDQKERRTLVALIENDRVFGIVDLLHPTRKRIEILRRKRLEKRDVRQKLLSRHGCA